ncbi:MAG: hypothetical protein LH645_01820 [Actinomycetia bacterium]|nr:hypothetical protein [Actinomycetes bacterium]
MSTTLSCGQCGAQLRAEQDWCSLCYAGVEPSFDPLTAPLEQVVGRSEAPEPPVADPVIESAPATPVGDLRLDRASNHLAVSSPEEPVDTTDDKSAVEVSDLDVMFSMLAAEHRRSDVTAQIVDRLEDRSTRIAVMVGGMVLVGAVSFLVLTVLGAIF